MSHVVHRNSSGNRWRRPRLVYRDVQSLAVDFVIPGTVYAGTRGGGVFVSTNGGASWSAANVGLYNPFVRALAIEPGRLYAGTGASGVFVTKLPTSATAAFLGKWFVVRDPNTDDASRRVITALASGPSTATLDVDALVNGGATLTVSARGETFHSQTFVLPPPWKRVGARGARYIDPKGVHGPVTSVSISKSASGVPSAITSACTSGSVGVATDSGAMAASGSTPPSTSAAASSSARNCS